MKQSQKGFSLIELMIVVAIIGILAAVAIPAYQNYIKKSAYTEVTTAMGPYKLAVEEWYQNTSSLTGITMGTGGFPSAPTASTARLFNTLSVSSVGVITAGVNAYKGIPAAATDCVLTPATDGDRLVWTYSGNCVTNGYVKAN